MMPVLGEDSSFGKRVALALGQGGGDRACNLPRHLGVWAGSIQDSLC